MGKKSSFTVLKNTLRVQKQLNNSLKFIHAWSKAEQKYLLNFTNKSKLVYIPNAIITNNITSETMCNLFNKVYQKIVDTYVNIVIDPQIKKDIFTLLQINLNQNHQHKTTVMTDFVTKMQTYTMEQWRLVFLLAYNQGVLDYLNAALDKIGIHPPKINVQQIEQFNLHKQNTKFITENISIDNPEKKFTVNSPI